MTGGVIDDEVLAGQLVERLATFGWQASPAGTEVRVWHPMLPVTTPVRVVGGRFSIEVTGSPVPLVAGDVAEAAAMAAFVVGLEDGDALAGRRSFEGP